MALDPHAIALTAGIRSERDEGLLPVVLDYPFFWRLCALHRAIGRATTLAHANLRQRNLISSTHWCCAPSRPRASLKHRSRMRAGKEAGRSRDNQSQVSHD